MHVHTHMHAHAHARTHTHVCTHVHLLTHSLTHKVTYSYFPDVLSSYKRCSQHDFTIYSGQYFVSEIDESCCFEFDMSKQLHMHSQGPFTNDSCNESVSHSDPPLLCT